jgi:prevent-host-death family protein
MLELEVGSFEAKNRLSELLKRVEKGDRVFITRRGRRIAVLAPVEVVTETDRFAHSPLLDRLRALRAQARPGPETLKQLVDEGRA